jgi:peptide/nickel transport system permease protein
MRAYVLRRILHMVPTLFGVILLTFALFQVVGGNPVYQRLGKNATAAEVARLTRQMGLDKPLWERFLHYIGDLAQLDFGRSWETHQRISAMIWDGLWPSLSLALPAFVLGTAVSLALALLAAAWRGRWLDKALVLAAILGMSVSLLAIIITAQYLLAFRLDLFPISGWEAGPGGWPYLALPIVIWIASQFGPDMRYYRALIIEELGREYVRAAEARGLPYPRILTRHVLRNAAAPIITQLALALPYLFTGSLLLENFFGIPGLGNLSIAALNASDLPVIQAMVVVGAAIYMLANLLGDLLHAAVDPRVRLS